MDVNDQAIPGTSNPYKSNSISDPISKHCILTTLTSPRQIATMGKCICIYIWRKMHVYVYASYVFGNTACQTIFDLLRFASLRFPCVASLPFASLRSASLLFPSLRFALLRFASPSVSSACRSVEPVRCAIFIKLCFMQYVH